jgi:hypothetical protein
MTKKRPIVRTEISARLAGAMAPSQGSAPPAAAGIGPPTVAHSPMPRAEETPEPQPRSEVIEAHVMPMPAYPHGRGGTDVVPMPATTAPASDDAPATPPTAVRQQPAGQEMPRQ